MLTNDWILVGDIGGTNTRLALAKSDRGKIHVEQFEKFRANEFRSFDDIVKNYLTRQGLKPIAASLAIAGPIQNGSVTLTNRDWTISASELVEQFKFQHVQMHNDFAAMSRSVLLMNDDSFQSLYDSGLTNAKAPIVVAGPGTGFGMGIVIPSNPHPVVLPSEGGHQAYAPQTRTEFEILSILQKDHDFVSLELVCSGSGMDAVHKAICEIHDVKYVKTPPQLIRRRAEEGELVCSTVCEVRAAAVMGAVGDMALTCGALGGVVLAGGVSERLIDYISTPKAMERFFNRGPRSDYMKRISIRLLKNPEAPLYGAAALYNDLGPKEF